MKNLVVIGELIHPLHDAEGPHSLTSVASVCFDLTSSELILLTSDGILIRCRVEDKITVVSPCVNVNSALKDDDEPDQPVVVDHTWFLVSFVSETSDLVCISHTGNIVCLHRSGDMDHEGCVEGGIGSAVWSADQTTVILTTLNNSLLSMSNSFEVLQEVPLSSPIALGTAVSMCSSGSSDHFAISSVDAEDTLARIRVYNKDLEEVAVSRLVGDGSASIVKGIHSTCSSFATNGSLIAFPLERVKGKLQVL